MRFINSYLATIVLLVLSACASGDLSSGQSKETELTPVGSTKLKYLLEALPHNMAVTQLTAHVKIDKVMPVGLSDQEVGSAIDYHVNVLEVYQGEYTKSMLSYRRYVELGDVTAQERGDLLIVSLCIDGKGHYYLPDIGFDMTASTEVLSAVASIKHSEVDTVKAAACEVTQ